MAFTSYLKTCVRNTPGNQYQVYLAPIASLTSITLTTNEVSAVTMNGGALFQRVQGKLDQVRMVKAANVGNNFSETQTLTMRFDKATSTLATWFYGTDGIANQIVCGMAAIRVDGNGQAWISGVSPASVEGLLRPYQKATINFDSGVGPTEEDAAQPELVLERTGAAPEYAFDSSTNAAIVGGTAAWINWAS
jgi:hypothetical protein